MINICFSEKGVLIHIYNAYVIFAWDLWGDSCGILQLHFINMPAKFCLEVNEGSEVTNKKLRVSWIWPGH